MAVSGPSLWCPRDPGSLWIGFLAGRYRSPAPRETSAERLHIDHIDLGERRREDYGDIEGLALSIQRFGLLHPVVVDDDNLLLAGERRLRACQTLGHTEIDVRRFNGLSDAEKRQIELEENLRRKDLTEYERSKKIVALAETAQEVAKEEPETRLTVSQVSRGPLPTPGSSRDVAARTGVPRQTIVRAHRHVAAVEAYPELADDPQGQALEAAKALDDLTEERRKVACKHILAVQAHVGRLLGYGSRQEYADWLAREERAESVQSDPEDEARLAKPAAMIRND